MDWLTEEYFVSSINILITQLLDEKLHSTSLNCILVFRGLDDVLRLTEEPLLKTKRFGYLLEKAPFFIIRKIMTKVWMLRRDYQKVFSSIS